MADEETVPENGREAALREMTEATCELGLYKEKTTGWRPMADAPRGETRVLLALPSGRWPVIGFWSDWNNWWTTGEVDRMHEHVPLPAPKAWQPLPELPQ